MAAAPRQPVRAESEKKKKKKKKKKKPSSSSPPLPPRVASEFCTGRELGNPKMARRSTHPVARRR